jgi:O-antigen ligase
MINRKIIVLARFFFCLCIVFLPLQIRVLLVDFSLPGSDFFNPYLSHFLYLADVFLLLTLFFVGVNVFLSGSVPKFRGGRVFYLLLAFVGTYFFSLIFSFNPLNSFFYSLKALELLLIYYLLRAGLVDRRTVEWILIGVISFAACVGILQYFTQSSLGLFVLGEPHIAIETKGVAKLALGPLTTLRSYGLFAHPNIFGGYLVFALFLLVRRTRSLKVLNVALFLVCFSALLLTFSRSAIVAFVLMMLYFFFQKRAKILTKKIVAVALVLVGFLLVSSLGQVLMQRFSQGDQLAFDERALYLDISWEMFKSNPMGVGAGNYTMAMSEYSPVKLMPWQFQPVHNIYLLVLNELGVLGFLIFLALLSCAFYKQKAYRPLLVALMLIGVFDHYLISLPVGMNLLILGLVVGD